MKSKEVLEILDDMSGMEIIAGFKCPSRGIWEKRLRDAVYSEVSTCLKYMKNITKPCSLSSFVMSCYDKDLVEVILRLVNTKYEHLILDAIKEFAKESI